MNFHTERQLSFKSSRKTYFKKMFKKALRNYDLYLFLLPSLVYIIIFNYWPMYGVQIAFKDFNVAQGIWGSPWVGFEHFERFFSTYYFYRVIRNTVVVSLYGLVAGFPFPIMLALMLNEVKNQTFKRVVQTVTYAPNFISVVVMVGMILIFLHPRYGMVNTFIKMLGFKPVDFINKAYLFKHIYVWSGIWQHTGFGSVIYFAALTSVDPQQHEAAIIEGASRLQRIWYINIPVLIPIAVILLILNAGSIMSVGFEKIFLMQKPLNMESSDVISTYVYRMGLVNAEYSFSSAVGLFNSVVNALLLIIVNWIARRMSETSLW
ncbi:MAG: sugar ABC transporter permease [Firmicutes bacterium]|nr:sugar ABC transporter permease [Bacillota bacterium]